MNALGNMHEVRFPSIFIQSNIVHCIFPRPDKPLVTYLQCIMKTSKIKRFLIWVFIITDRKIYFFMIEEMKRKAQKH